KAIFLTHAHLDHSGNIPNIVKKGYQHRIFATPATIDIVELLLLDAAHIFEQDIKYLNKRLKKKNLPLKEPLYSIDDAKAAIGKFSPLDYHKPIVKNGYDITLFDAGHILGSAQVRIRTDSGSILFTGDLGRVGMPFIRDPEFGLGADVLVMESTYGGRIHEPLEVVKRKLKVLIERVFRRRSRLLIPAFAVERTQDLIYLLHEMEDDLPPVPIYVDSPLATNVTDVFRRHGRIFDKETRELLERADDPLGFGRLHYTRSVEDSKALNDCDGPVVIISASGMCEGGRVLHHLKRVVKSRENIILFIGFQARNTLGRRIVDGAKRIKVFGDEYDLKCHVEHIDGLSSHADSDDLCNYVRRMPNLKKLFLVHGEEDEMEKLRARLIEQGFAGEIHIPEPQETYRF
ncbi:MAG TPA: MBL fold metallo-hydrolase, partial [bacterium (Candidatus Stahlbacteria)]|nr:MBL fold metallo-hydrolase [Candidatus Stahlbacteria bacterium]